MDGVVVSVAAGARQVFQSKATNPMATALATMLKSKVACATSALADHNGSILMVLGGVRYERYEHATAGVVEQPRVPERHCDRPQKVTHEDGRLQTSLFQEEEG